MNAGFFVELIRRVNRNQFPTTGIPTVRRDDFVKCEQAREALFCYNERVVGTNGLTAHKSVL
jgi:hypothetical protein